MQLEEATKNDGNLLTTGFNGNGQLGHDKVDHRTFKLVPVKGPNGQGLLTDVIAIDAGSLSTIVLKKDGTVWEFGHGSQQNIFTPVFPRQIGELSNIKAISAGGTHNLALREDGKVFAWGPNNRGQLGDGTLEDSWNEAVEIKGLNDIIQISAGGFHSLALKKDGTVWGWGINFLYQVGLGHNEDVHIPTQIEKTARWGAFRGYSIY